MNKIIKIIIFYIAFFGIVMDTHAQLSEARMRDLAQNKVTRFQNILDLTTKQSNQLRSETIKLMQSQAKVDVTKNFTAQISDNFKQYYSSLTTLKPEQLATLRLMDELDRQNRRETYKDLMMAYGQTSEFGVAVATYNWNIVMPVLVSYRKDLNTHIIPADREIIAEMRTKMLAKYDFMSAIREQSQLDETESIVEMIHDEILEDIQYSALPQLLKKYEVKLAEVKVALAKYEKQFKKDIISIYEDFLPDNHKNQLIDEQELIAMYGVTGQLRDTFFLLMDGESRPTSFKINTLHNMMAFTLAVED